MKATANNVIPAGFSAMLLLAAALAAPPAEAQWITFTDETDTRLILQSFADAPLDDPLLDAEEKDMAVADLDHDGDDDVIVVRKRPFSNAGVRQDVLLMNEGGVLVDRSADLAPEFLSDPTDARDVFIGDFTGDGWEDVVIANTFGQQPSFYRNAGEIAGVWQGLVEESSRLPFLLVPADVSVLQFCGVWGGDVDGDGSMDIYLANYNQVGGTTDVLFMNDGSGNFTNETTARLGNYAKVAFGTGVEIRDVDGDGDNDIIKVSTLYSVPPFPVGTFLLFNDGNGNFDTLPYQSLPVSQPYMFGAGDLDNSGSFDIYLVDDGQDSVIVETSSIPDNQVNYDFATVPGTRTGSFGGNVKMRDMDGDGDLDVGVAPIDVDIANCGFSEDFALLRNDGSGGLSDPYLGGSAQNFHVDPHDFDFLDLDGDGCQDVFMALCTGWKVFRQDCTTSLPAPLNSFSFLLGDSATGGLPDVQASDDSYIRINGQLNAAETIDRTALLLTADSPQLTVSGMQINIEMAASAPGTLARVRILKPGLSTWDVALSTPLTVTDTVYNITPPGAPSDYIRSDGRITFAIQTFSTVTAAPNGHISQVDHAEVIVTP